MKTRSPADEDAPPEGRSRRPPVGGDDPRTATGLLDLADPGTMIGRQAELSRLRTAWHEALSGKRRVMLLAGEPGSGKTRLAAELAGIVETSGERVLVGRCRRDIPVPYEPFVQAMTPVLAQRSDAWVRDHVKRHGSALARLFPDVAHRLGGADVDEPVGPRPQLLGAMAAALREPGGRPLLLILEDLQWATCSTVLLLKQLAHDRAPRPLLIVATYRDAAIHPSHPLANFLDDPAVDGRERLVLANLSPQAVATLLVDRAAVAGKAAASVAASLWRVTKGNPLLVTEMIRDFVPASVLGDGAVDTSAAENVRVDHDMADVVAGRVGRPGSQARIALQTAAVAGMSFSSRLVAQLCGRKDEEIQTALAKAVRASLILPVAGRPGDYRFTHDLVRDAAYQFLGPHQRVRLHHDVARVLQGPDHAGHVSAAELLHHLAAASPVGKCPEAATHAQRAGQAAIEVLAFEEAAEFFGKALAFLGTGHTHHAHQNHNHGHGHGVQATQARVQATQARVQATQAAVPPATPAGVPPTRTDLLVQVAEANQRAGESARARQSYLQAAAVARGNQDGPGLGRAVLGLGEVLGVWGADGSLIGLLEQALDANPDDPSLRAKLLARLAQARTASGSPGDGKEQSDTAWELAWDSRDPETMGAVLRARHEALSAPDDLEDRVEIDGELYAMATASKDVELAVLAHGWRLVDLLEQGHVVDADRDRKLHAQLARRLGDPTHQRDASAWAATWALLKGRPSRASSHIDRALAFGQQAGDPHASSLYWVQQHALQLEWGADAEMDGLAEVWRDVVRSHDRDPAWRASLALLLARTGRVDEAREELDDLLAEECVDLPLDRDWLPTVASIGEVAACLGDSRTVLLAKLLGPYARRLIVVGRASACRGSVARVLGLLWGSAGEWTKAERHFQAGLSLHDRLGAGPLLARTRSEFGRVLAAKPGGPLHVGRVRTTLTQALEEADRFGMVRLAAETAAALEALPSPSGN